MGVRCANAVSMQAHITDECVQTEDQTSDRSHDNITLSNSDG